jgi:hypothetical protein
MGRNYTRTSTRGNYGAESLSKALTALSEGTPLKTAARQCGIPPKTLRRHRDGKVGKPGAIRLGRFDAELNEDYEKELVCVIQRMEKALFGLSTVDVRSWPLTFLQNGHQP